MIPSIFHGAEYEKKGIVKGAVLLPRAATQPRVEYTSGLLKNLVVGIAKDMLAANQHKINKINGQLTAMSDGDEVTDLRALKEKISIEALLSTVCSFTRRVLRSIC